LNFGANESIESSRINSATLVKELNLIALQSAVTHVRPILAQSRCRAQSGTSRLWTDIPKADIDYRLPPILVVNGKVPEADICLLKRVKSTQSIKRGDMLTIHAKDELLKSYGLVFFGNSGWDLKPDEIEQYAQGTETRRVHNQLAILCAVKGRTSEELMGLHEALKQLPFNPASVFEKLGIQNC
jgi:hypothetical protein